MKSWRLDDQQRVCVDLHRNVHFHHYYNAGKRVIALSWRQFLNLNDILLDLETFKNMKYYPLGKNLWLQHDKNRIQLYHCHQNSHFSFHDRSWSKYIRETHRRILSFLRHEASVHRRQHVASDATLFQSQSRDMSSPNVKHENLSRSSSHVSGENEQRKKCANLSEWDSSNSGRPFSFIGSINALRTAADPTSDMEEGEVCDIELDCGQPSDIDSFE